ncbi:inositol polyphosphate kinase family protein [Actinacidiphila sp. bgisy167]|uniref:inositol polyphosphate kinase family protein n=1 Tax=Actinacidiphila sp. bgisy167 TaxID=3413797 RepID=UPI003D7383FF
MAGVPMGLVCFDDLPREVARAVKKEPDQLAKINILIEHYSQASRGDLLPQESAARSTVPVTASTSGAARLDGARAVDDRLKAGSVGGVDASQRRAGPIGPLTVESTTGAVSREASGAASGGHGGIVKRAGGMVLQKPTNDVERNFYNRLRGSGTGLERIAPRSFTAHDVWKLESELDPDHLVPARDVEASGEDPHIYIENITHGMVQPSLLDIKIGESTASQHELRRNLSPGGAWVKKRKLMVADVASGSARRGWRVVAGTKIQGSRMQIGRASSEHVADFAAPIHSLATELAAQLQNVRDAVAVSGYALVGASVLIAVDRAADDPGQSVRVKLIDFAHSFTAVDLGPQQYEKYTERFLHGLDNVITEIATLDPASVRSVLGFRERVMSARRVWDEPVPQAVARLEAALLAAGPGARALVVGAVLEALWAVNHEGVVSWQNNRGQRVSSPHADTDQPVWQIALSPHGNLLHVPEEWEDAGPEMTNFCSLTPGMKLTPFLQY